MPNDRRIIVGSDHGGLSMKYELLQALQNWGWKATDVGCGGLADNSSTSLAFDQQTGTLTVEGAVDYPDYAQRVAQALADGEFSLGLLLCGSGIGMSIAANKVRGVRAALCGDTYSAAMSRAHNDANVLCIGGRVVGPEMGREILKAFLEGTFAGGRHQRRVNKIIALENQ